MPLDPIQDDLPQEQRPSVHEWVVSLAAAGLILTIFLKILFF